MRNALRGMPAFPRLALSGLLWGVACGVGAAALLILLMASGGADASGFDGAYDFVAGLLVFLAMGSVYGAVIGGVLGTATGLVAGLVLTVLLEMISPRAAAVVTVVVVLGVQVTIGYAVTDLAGIWWILPAFAILPLISTASSAADDWAERTQRRDTLAA